MNGSASSGAPAPRLLYVCLERIVRGSAAATHVHEICAGLRRRGIPVRLIAEEGARDSRLLGQFVRYARILAASALALPRADVVYLRSHFAGFPLAVLARLLGRPVVHEINGVYGDAFVTHPRFRRLRSVLARLQKAQYRWSSALVAVTPDLVAWGRAEAGHDRVALVGNAANTELFRPEGPRTIRERPYALFFGGLVRWHGIDVMLAAARSPAWPAGLDLVIAGPIVDESLRPLLDRSPPGVIWLGPRDQADLAPLVRGALAAVAMISNPEGRSSQGVMPLKLFEALACGTPAIVSDLPGQGDFVRNGGCGVVVPVGDADALARAVADLAGDPAKARRLGEAGARLVAAEHSWDARAQETAQLLRALLPASSRPARA